MMYPLQLHTIGALLLTYALLFGGRLSAQFAGGSGGGFTVRVTVQLSLDGLPGGVQALYRGSQGDGFDQARVTATLTGSDLAVIYHGGRADGFDSQTAEYDLSGQPVAVLYRGGEGDGADRLTTALTLTGIELSALYSGGSGDGFDRVRTSATFEGTPLTLLYGGGVGDGFDFMQAGTALDGTTLMPLYAGGVGDGFDRSQLTSTPGGQDLAVLFLGGNGDGFSAESFAGIVPLPLTLISFEAFPRDEYVLLRWVTEDEVDTDFFTIEKTRDGVDYSEVGTLTAAGYSPPGQQLAYELEDDAPYGGTSYYRLRTTDFDSAISLSHLVAVHYGDGQDWSFTLFPNPSTGRHFSVTTEGLRVGDRLTLEVFDAAGKLLLTESHPYGADNDHRVELTDRLMAGSYLIRLGSRERGQISKMLIVQ